MQAISGAGFEGVAAMAIYDNVIPYIGKEEEKMETETLKIMGTLKGGKITECTTIASAQVVTGSRSLTVIRWRSGLTSRNPWTNSKKHSGITNPRSRVSRHSRRNLFTSLMRRTGPPAAAPRSDAGKGMTVSVGRLREGIRFIAMGHNTIRGAAGASVMNAELISKKKYL